MIYLFSSLLEKMTMECVIFTSLVSRVFYYALFVVGGGKQYFYDAFTE